MRWKKLAEQEVVRNQWITVKKATFELPSGRVLEDYWLVEKPSFVVVVAQCEGDVILIREYRPGTDQFYLSPPAGYIDEGETPQQAAMRECFEETGYEAVSTQLLADGHFSPGWFKGSAFVVLAQVRPVEGEVKIDEEISEVVRMPWPEVLGKITSGEIQEMQAVAALLLARQMQL